MDAQGKNRFQTPSYVMSAQFAISQIDNIRKKIMKSLFNCINRRRKLRNCYIRFLKKLKRLLKNRMIWQLLITALRFIVWILWLIKRHA
jgi:hypothetical protein